LTRIVQLAEEKGLREPNGRMRRGRPVSMIVLCPTRELARQVQDEIAMVARPLGLYVDVFHGGVSYDGQVSLHALTCSFEKCDKVAHMSKLLFCNCSLGLFGMEWTL